MRILIDLTPVIINKTGVHQTGLDLARALPKYFECYFKFGPHIFSLSQLQSWDQLTPPKKLKQQVQGFFFSHLRKKIDPETFPDDLLILDADVLLLLDPLYALFYPRSVLDRAVTMILDLTPITVPDWHESHICKRYQAAYLHLQASQSKLVSISQSTADDLWVNYGLGGSTVIPLYLRELPTTSTLLKQDNPFLLFVGSLEIRKNLLNIICAYGKSNAYQKNISLYIVGGAAYRTEEIKALGAKTPGVKFLGFVSDKELEQLYASCLGMVYVSQWEGFGFPLLEAMAYKVPCISSITGASPEVGGDAVLYANPYNTDEIAQKINQLIALSSEERQELEQKAFTRSHLFTKEIFLRKMHASLVEKINENKSAPAKRIASSIFSTGLVPAEACSVNYKTLMRQKNAFSRTFIYLRTKLKTSRLVFFKERLLARFFPAAR